MSTSGGAGIRGRYFLDGDEVVGPDGTRYGIAWAIEQLPWRTALPGGGMPTHQYVVIGASTLPASDVLGTAIRDHPASFDAYFRGYQRPMRYLELGDHRYWRTSAGPTHMLNRCTLDSVEPPRRVADGARPLPWVGPRWAPYGSPWPPGYVRDDDGRWVYRQELDPRRAHSCVSCGFVFWLTAPERPCPHCGQVQ
jgi:hypothetical protein